MCSQELFVDYTKRRHNMELNKIYNMDCLDGMRLLDDVSVDCIVTSPPYYQLRDYGTDGQIGLEETWQEYIAKLEALFAEAHRVLKRSGTIFVVISDTYAGNKTGITDAKLQYVDESAIRKRVSDIPSKSLMLIPERFVIMMSNLGYIVRSKPIWWKRNVMPQSVADRPTVDYENVYFFTKEQNYFYNQLKEDMVTSDFSSPRGSKSVLGSKNSGRRKQDEVGRNDYSGFNDRYSPPKDGKRNMRTVWDITPSPSDIEHFAMFPDKIAERMILLGCPENGIVLDPFMGSGTTAKMARLNNRNFIGFEISSEYCDIATKRVQPYLDQINIFDLEKEAL